MSWTDDRVAVLKKLWTEGHSASQIAAELGGVTRNAVIGKVHRLGLSGRATPSRPIKRPKRKAPPKARPQIATKDGTIVVSSPKPVHNAPTTPQLLPDGKPVTMLTVKDGMCKWPLGDPGTDDFCLCGRNSKEGSPYCTAHSEVAFQPSTRKTSKDNEAQKIAKKFAAAG